MAVAVIAEISAATGIIRLEPPHAVRHRVATVARLVGVGTAAVVGSSEHSADDGAADYGWRPYWGGTGFLMGGYGGYCYGAITPLPSPESTQRAEDIAAAQRSHDDPHLRSIEAVTGYHIHASDGEIGHIEDFLVEDTDWSIHNLVIDTKNWWPGKKVLISPRSIREIDWMNMLVKLNVDREKVKDSPIVVSL